MRKEWVWRCLYEDGFFVDLRGKTKPKTSPYPHPDGLELARVEKVEDPKVETVEGAWEAITREVHSYAQEMNYTYQKSSQVYAKYSAVYELCETWEYANRCPDTLLKLRCFFLQSWLHYGRDGGYQHLVPHVSIISVLIKNALHMNLRDTKEEILERISALASSQSSAVRDTASWVLYALTQSASPRYGRQHIVDVCITQLMQTLRREDQKEADVLIAGMLTELWDALFEEEKR